MTPPEPELPRGLPGDVSRETLMRLERYVALLEAWNPRVNLVARGTLPEVWTRHIADSAQLLALAPAKTRSWIDLGSGGGFPGMVCAILAAQTRPDLAFTLVDSDRRKCAFLQAVARETGIAAPRIEAARIESLPPRPVDIISARALAPLPTLFEQAARFLHPGTICLFPKGTRADAEIAAAERSWRFMLRRVPSITSPESHILCCEGVERA